MPLIDQFWFTSSFLTLSLPTFVSYLCVSFQCRALLALGYILCWVYELSMYLELKYFISCVWAITISLRMVLLIEVRSSSSS